VAVLLPPQGSQRIDGHETLDRLELAADPVHGRDILARGDQQLRLGVIDDIAPLRRCQPVVQRDRHHPCFGRAIIQEGILDTVLPEQGYPITELEAGVDAGVGQTIHLRQGLTIG
jgi:hypothetical protein